MDQILSLLPDKIVEIFHGIVTAARACCKKVSHEILASNSSLTAIDEGLGPLKILNLNNIKLEEWRLSL